jgi:hypothetical protein
LIANAHQEMTAFACAFVAGWGGLASCLAYLQITDVLNRERGRDDRIPQFILSWKDLLRREDFASRHGFFYSWKLVREFHRKLPHRREYWWFCGGLVWAALFGVSAAFLIL